MEKFKNYVVMHIYYVKNGQDSKPFSPSMKVYKLKATKVINGLIVENYEKFVKPATPIDSKDMDRFGLTNDILNNSPDIYNEISTFIKFIDNLPIITYNHKNEIEFFDLCYGQVISKLIKYDGGYMRKIDAMADLDKLENKPLDKLFKIYNKRIKHKSNG